MTFSMIDFIERKRDKGRHTDAELADFVRGVRDAEIPDYQTSAWLMAAYLNGLERPELGAFTKELAHSGDIVKLPGGRTAVDKHSTGGVGDKTTLVVAPLVACCGLNVAKLSGRGLGFTGGTVDKLEAIPGMNMHLSTKAFARQIAEIGVAVTGHSMALAPAEGKFYALRDVTGTVSSIPLIASSIVSKKIAGGADAFVFDVKCGSGAFMQTYEDAEALARSLVDLSASLGRRSVCLISDMEQPLGTWVGNSAEVLEAIEVLSGRGPADTRDLSVALAAEMLVAGGVSLDSDSAKRIAAEKLQSGEALEKFTEVVRMQGGDSRVCREPLSILPLAVKREAVAAELDGFVSRLDARTVGYAIRALGGGRARKEDDIDAGVAIELVKKVGDRVSKGEPLAILHYNTEAQLRNALPYMVSAYACSDSAQYRTLLLGRVA